MIYRFMRPTYLEKIKIINTEQVITILKNHTGYELINYYVVKKLSKYICSNITNYKDLKIITDLWFEKFKNYEKALLELQYDLSYYPNWELYQTLKPKLSNDELLGVFYRILKHSDKNVIGFRIMKAILEKIKISTQDLIENLNNYFEIGTHYAYESDFTFLGEILNRLYELHINVFKDTKFLDWLLELQEIKPFQLSLVEPLQHSMLEKNPSLVSMISNLTDRMKKKYYGHISLGEIGL